MQGDPAKQNRRVTMKTIKNQYGVIGLLGQPVEAPSAGWAAMQEIKPKKNKGWFSFYPLSGGAGIVQEGAFEILREATSGDLDEAISGHGFNPAADAIKSVFGCAS